MPASYRLYSSLPPPYGHKTYAEIDLSALKTNFLALKAALKAKNPRGTLISVVKADAYGHGAPAVVSSLLSVGCSFFAVSSLEEVVSVRKVCLAENAPARVLILGYTDPQFAPELARFDLLQSVLSYEYAKRLSYFAASSHVPVHVHLAVDTGMNRIGFLAHGEDEIASAAAEISCVFALPNLQIDGMFTHFARADEEKGGNGDALTDQQVHRFRRLAQILRANHVKIPFLHVSNSAGLARRGTYGFDGARAGILLYGVPPSPFVETPNLCPVMKLRTTVSHVHPLLAGESVGYGGKFRAERVRRIATLPVGYADGLLRGYEGGTVTVYTRRGAQKCPIVGNICMDQCMVDVTGTCAEIGDGVTVFGNDQSELHALSERAGTTEYESLCLISARVPRVYRDEKESK